MSDEPKDIPAMGDTPLDPERDLPRDSAPEADPRLTGRKELMPPDWDEAEDGEWDDYYASPEAIAEGADLQLVVEYLNKHLEPDQMEAVRKRLAEDEKLADLAAPLIFVWSIPTHLERHPRPAGELERSWEKFATRAGITYRPPKARRRRRRRLWLLGIALVVLGVTGLLARRPLADWYVTQRDYDVVATQGTTDWLHLGDSVFVQPTAGASLRASRSPVDERLHVILDGTARFRVAPRDTVTPTPFHRGIVVRTRAGLADSREAEFTVAASGDSAVVEVHRPTRRLFIYFIPVGTQVAVRRDADGNPVDLLELGRAQLVRGQFPTRLPKAQEP